MVFLLQRIYQKHIPGQAYKYWIVFSVPVGSPEEKSQVEFHPDVPTLSYQQHDQNIFFLQVGFWFCCIFDILNNISESKSLV